MDAEVQNASEQQDAHDELESHDEQQGWRSWFRRSDVAGEGDEQVGQDGSELGEAGTSDVGTPNAGTPNAGTPNAGTAGESDQAGSDSEFPAGPYEVSTQVDEVDDLAAASSPAPGRRPTRRARPAGQPTSKPGSRRITDSLITGPLINPRLRADPRLRVWVSRTALCLVVFLAVSIWKDWRFGVTAAVIVACADTIFRSRITGITPSSARVTAAQRNTRRRLRVLRAAGYMALHARRIPGTESIIDHIIIGPSGVFTLDSQRMDTRLPVRAIGGMLFHGPRPQTEKIDHARYEAQQAAALIGAELGQRVRVRPAMVIYGPNLPWVIMRLKGVDVFDGGHVSNYFRRQSKATIGHHLDSAQVALVFAAAAHALPSLD